LHLVNTTYDVDDEAYPHYVVFIGSPLPPGPVLRHAPVGPSDLLA
jgi:hypothetical protein